MASIWIIGAFAFVIFPLNQKTQEVGVQKYDSWVSPRGATPHTYAKWMGKPSQNTAQLCTKAHGCANDDLRTDKLRKAGVFGSVPGMLTHLTGRLN